MERVHNSTTLFVIFCLPWWKIPVNFSEVLFCMWLQHFDYCTLDYSLDEMKCFYCLALHVTAGSDLFFPLKLLLFFFSEMAQTWVFFTGFCGFQSCLRSPATFVFGKVSDLALLPASIPHPIPLIWFPKLGNFHQFYNLTELPKILLPAMLAFFFLDAFCYVVCLVVRFKSRTA